LACWCNGKCPHLAPALGAIRAGQLMRADQILRRVLAENPGCGEAHMAFAHVLQETNHAAFAVPHIETAEKILGPHPKVISQKAHVMRNAVQLGAAITASRAAIAAEPDNALHWAALADHLQADGLLDEMTDTLRQAKTKFGPRHPQLRRMMAQACMELKDHAGAIEALAGDDLGELDLFERGRAYEAAGRYPQAWADWMRAKSLQQARGCVWNRSQAENRFAMLTDGARRRRFADLPRAELAPGLAQPIFITGQPRSGTTMLEAALASHPQIAGGDELMMMPDLLALLPGLLGFQAPYPLILGALRLADNCGMVELMRDFYLRKSLQKMGHPKVAYFTDKMPSNELHWPLLHLLFPQSPIIATRRHPLDVVVSNMSHHLVHGAFISCSLDGFALNYAMVQRLLAHYEKQIAGLQLVRVPYEKFVADHRAGIDAMLPAGLPRDQACYDFHLSTFRSRTISHRQIKKPVNDKSIGRYKPFLDFLKPVLPTLAPIMEAQGYVL
jgi:hypothetical protein